MEISGMMTRVYDGPCGKLLLATIGGSLCLCDWMAYGRVEKTLRRLERILRDEENFTKSHLMSKENSPILNQPENQCQIGKTSDLAPREGEAILDRAPRESSAILDLAQSQLDEYFAGGRKDFDIPLATFGTDFQRLVWEALRCVPYGCTSSYAAMAREIQRPRSTRAVANATGANALSIFIPCHRIIGSDGTLTGYAGGLQAKRHLLALEAPNTCLI